MALRIVKASDPITVNRLNLCIYAPPGVGKTSLLNTAEAPITLDFDHGIHRAKNRRDSVPVDAWSDVEEITPEFLAPYRTVGVDTAGRALDFLGRDITARDSKCGSGGDLNLKGYGKLKSRFSTWMKLLNSFGKDVVLICHMDEQKDGDRMLERLDAQGSSKNEIYKTADAMGRIFVRDEMVNGKKVVKRYIDFSPREGSFGKNPAQLQDIEFPDPSVAPNTLANVIQLIKDKLNAMSDEQLEAQRIIEEWATAINDLKVVDEFNKLIPDVKKAPDAVKMYLHGKAKDLGFVFNKKAGLYEAEPLHA